MYKQLVFCLETTRRAGTDWIYVKDTIDSFYQLTNRIKLSPIYMESKMRYGSEDVRKKISKMRKEYEHGETYVIYCIDVDDFESNPDHVRDFKEISAYVRKNGYDLIWFCHDIEDVFLERRIAKHEKVKEATSFRRRRGIESIDASRLKSDDQHRVHSSNILSVLDGLFSTSDFNQVC